MGWINGSGSSKSSSKKNSGGGLINRPPSGGSSSKGNSSRPSSSYSKGNSGGGLIKGVSSGSGNKGGGLIKGVSSGSGNKGGGLINPRPGSSSYKPSPTYNTNTGGGLIKRPPSSGSGNGGYVNRTQVAGSYTNTPSGVKGGTGGVNIPRYNNPNFKGTRTTPSGITFSGAKVIDGVVRWPDGARVDPAHAARVQAYIDAAYGETSTGNSSMGDIYGQAYWDEIYRLNNLAPGEPPGGYPQGSAAAGRPSQRGMDDYYFDSDVLGAYTRSDDYMSDYEEALRRAEEEQAEALRKQIEQGVNSIYAQKDPLKEQYEKAAQQAYIAQMQGKKALPQQMSAQGLTGGATESANVALETNYQNGLNGLSDTYNAGLSQIDQDAANFQATGDISIAQNAAKYQEWLAQAGLQAQQQAAQIQAQKELAAYNARLQAEQDRREWEWKTRMYQNDLDSQKQMAQFNSQLDYDYWLKKQQQQLAMDSAPSKYYSNGGNVGGVSSGTEGDVTAPKYESPIQNAYPPPLPVPRRYLNTQTDNTFNGYHSLPLPQRFTSGDPQYDAIIRDMNNGLLSEYEAKRRIAALKHYYK